MFSGLALSGSEAKPRLKQELISMGTCEGLPHNVAVLGGSENDEFRHCGR